MHTYSLSPDARRQAQPYIIAMSLASAWFLAWGLDVVVPSVPWWVDVPASIGLYGLWWSLYDRVLWCSNLARVLGVAIVKLSGDWDGVLVSSLDQFDAQTPVHVRIDQTSTRIKMRLTTDRSESNTTGAILERDEAGVSLKYFFDSRPWSGTPDTMHAHLGAGFLELGDDELTGEYFTGRGRETHGRLSLHRRTSLATGMR